MLPIYLGVSLLSAFIVGASMLAILKDYNLALSKFYKEYSLFLTGKQHLLVLAAALFGFAFMPVVLLVFLVLLLLASTVGITLTLATANATLVTVLGWKGKSKV